MAYREYDRVVDGNIIATLLPGDTVTVEFEIASAENGKTRLLIPNVSKGTVLRHVPDERGVPRVVVDFNGAECHFIWALVLCEPNPLLAPPVFSLDELEAAERLIEDIGS